MTPHHARRALLALLTTACLVAGLGATAALGDPPERDGWHTSWSQSQQRVSTKSFDDQSMRMVTHLTQGGDAVRIRLQNQFGTGPVIIDQTSLARSAGGPAIVAGTDRVLTFGGKESVTIPVGGEVWSDPTSLATGAQDDVAVTFYLARPTVTSLHDRAGRTNYGAPARSGNRNAEVSGASFTEALPWTYFVSAVDVMNADLAGTIVAYGSSVVDGVGSENCGPGCDAFGKDRRWTDDLARRVATELPASQQVAVVNEGISGTTSAPECNRDGLDGVSRLDRDVLALHGVTGVIFYYGTNDIANGCSDATILASYRTIFQRLHDAGIKVFVTPITPRPGYTARMNDYRDAVNAFVRTGGDCSGTCDGVLDLDAVLQDPANPDSIDPRYDNGDGIHANVAGQQAIADSIPLELLAAAGAPADPAITAQVVPRCVGDRPYLAVRALNGSGGPRDVEIVTAYGSKSFSSVAPGTSAYQSFAVRGTTVGGTVQVRSGAPGDVHDGATSTLPYEAPDC
ncbi:GDSL-type esterase/lipase family protein [Cellulomonas sp. PhB143]|uniref:GDSL-type esterase/lipase family protein n=1 Tax=Cellulomonas sp. PhB143 TaxID=2485186 RepID=UPI000F48E143|nr:GDSL-type esterase/lipase family protein [Cellulomonas sp. PhB143]ROS75452.1 lysophospholipase L1-like esterase [Cellulomonas sp. PhB143]